MTSDSFEDQVVIMIGAPQSMRPSTCKHRAGRGLGAGVPRRTRFARRSAHRDRGEGAPVGRIASGSTP